MFFELQKFKAERSWHNLDLPRQAARTLLERDDWYTLYVPEDQLAMGDFRRVRLWQEMALTLLKKYCDRFYRYCKAAFEAQHLEYRELGEDDPNFFDEYRVLVQQSQEQLLQTLTTLKEKLGNGELADAGFGSFVSLAFDRHLYQPLLCCSQNDVVEVRPVALNDGERDFVKDLRSLYLRELEKGGGLFEGCELYLLRNQSRGRGVGFFEAGNFYPDFILWLVDGKRQSVTFVDPKGLRNVEGPNDPKLRFAETIKELEARLGDPAVTLDSFIVSRTPLGQLPWWDREMSQLDFEKRHVVFQTPGDTGYVQKILSLVSPLA